MIISDTKGFIFVHNPKCAGTSLRTSLKPYDTRDNYFWMGEKSHALNRTIDKAHIPLKYLAVAYPGVYSLMERYYVFTFVRDPYARFYSSFTEYMRHQKKDTPIPSGPAQLRDMINDFAVANINAKSVVENFSFRHFPPQHLFAYVGNKCRVDFIGRVERMEDSLKVIQEALNIPGITVPTKNAMSNRQEITEIFTKKTVDIIHRIYQKDFDLFFYDRYMS